MNYLVVRKLSFLLLFLGLGNLSCAKESPFLSGYVRRVFDAAMSTCDPYNQGSLHTCLVMSSAFQNSVYVYDATASEMVLAPNSYFPLKVKVGPTTEDLVTVVSDDKRFPLMLAMDHSEASIYPIRLFPSSDKKKMSFSQITPHSVKKAAFKSAAADIDGRIVVVQTFPNESAIEIYALKRESGEVDEAVSRKSIALGTKPSHLVINQDRTFAVVSDEGEDNIHILDLRNITAVLLSGAKESVSHINVGIKTDRLYLSNRDFGGGMHLFAMVFKSSGDEAKLADIDKLSLEASLMLDEAPIAGYFPDSGSDLCCGGKKNWFSIATIKGNLFYILVESSNGVISLTKDAKVELTSENNLALSKLLLRKILGGKVEEDATLERENLCPSNRWTFYLASYGNTRSYLYSDSVETEAHGYSCEGESAALRFGVKIH